jgi:hypothetical protein
MLCGVIWQLAIDVLGEPIGFNFKRQALDTLKWDR